MNQRKLDDLISRIRSRQIPDINGVIVIRHGYKVLEEYANGSSATQLHEMQSVTKSVTSLLIGIAVDQGKFNVDAKLLPFFPEYSDIITASGAKGQWLFIIPKYDLVVAATSNSATGQGFIDPLDFLHNYVIRSVEN
jgi:CubicO group peptidase (beta-lactamase class C family)